MVKITPDLLGVQRRVKFLNLFNRITDRLLGELDVALDACSARVLGVSPAGETGICGVTP